MDNKTKSIPFDENEQYLFQVCHPSISSKAQPLDIFSSKTTYPKAVKACIAMIKEFDLSWAIIMYGGWFRTILPESLWLTNSGMLISEQHSTFIEDKNEQQLLIDDPLLKRTVFGWGFYNSDIGMDSMAHKHIAWSLKPTLSKYFKNYKAFEYHLFADAPVIPEWLNGEFFEGEETLAIYGSRNEKSFDEYMAQEMMIAAQIQSVFGHDTANEWVKSYREFYWTGDIE